MPQTDWNVAEAKSRLSEVLNEADRKAQIITRRGTRYILIRSDQYEKLTGSSKTLKDLLLGADQQSLADLDLKRDRSPGREVEL